MCMRLCAKEYVPKWISNTSAAAAAATATTDKKKQLKYSGLILQKVYTNQESQRDTDFNAKER